MEPATKRRQSGGGGGVETKAVRQLRQELSGVVQWEEEELVQIPVNQSTVAAEIVLWKARRIYTPGCRCTGSYVHAQAHTVHHARSHGHSDMDLNGEYLATYVMCKLYVLIYALML